MPNAAAQVGKSLLRDPRCSVLISHVDWWSGFVVAHPLRQHGPRNLEALKRARRHIFGATTRRGGRD